MAAAHCAAAELCWVAWSGELRMGCPRQKGRRGQAPWCKEHAPATWQMLEDLGPNEDCCVVVALPEFLVAELADAKPKGLDLVVLIS